MPGVAAVLVASDVNHLTKNILVDGERSDHGGRPFRVLAAGDVRYVGEPIAMVVADSRYRAEDAVDAIEVGIDSMPAVVDIEHALDDDAPLVHPERESNLYGPALGLENPAVEELLASAPVVLTETFRQHRYATVPAGMIAAPEVEAILPKRWRLGTHQRGVEPSTSTST